MIGRRYNTDEKKERNVSSEIEASQHNFDVLERSNQLYTELFITQLEDITGKKIIKD
ncbi:MAG: hypothetical protein ACRCXY_11410 [Fusobacteriaceae bacterium]